MKTRGIVVLVLSACISGLGGGGDKSVSFSTEPVPASKSASAQVTENIDADEKTAAANLKPAKDPINEEIYAFRVETRRAYNNRVFDDLDKRAAELRASKETFGNGS